MSTNPIGIRNGSLNAHWREAFAKAKETGAECVELDVNEQFAEFPIYSKAGRTELKALEKSSGVALTSICLGAFWKFSPSSPDASIRRTAAKLLADTVEACDAYGVPYILAPLTDAKTEPVEKQREGWREVLKDVRDTVANARVKVALELCARDFAHSADDALALLEAAKSPVNMGVYYDTANGHGKGHRAEVEIPVLAKAGRLTIVHIKDTQGNHLGEGEVDFPAVRKALETAKYAGPYILETPGKNDPLPSARKNLDFTKKLFRGA